MPPSLDFLGQEMITLGYRSQGPYGPICEFTSGQTNGSISLEETDRKVILHTIDIEPKRTGLGSEIIEQLRQYCERENKDLLIPAVINLPFFARFVWLNWSEPKRENQLWAANYQPHNDGC